MITQLAHVCLGAADLPKAEHFYCTALGLKKGFRFLRDGKEFGFYLDLGKNTFIEVFAQPVRAADLPPIRHLCLQVTGMDDVIAQVRAHGYEVTDKKLGADQSWQCWLTDPSGVRIELHEYTAGSSQVTGRDCVLR
jgi:catechol 2,3-dioxygenase-like lactoylglutathione lyase family enzyme